MEGQSIKRNKPLATTIFKLRKVAKSGGSRYLSVSNIIPLEWQAVKVYVIEGNKDYCVLKLVKIA